MDITNRLLRLDKSLKIFNEGKWSNTESRYSAFNDAGVECETGEFLYSLLRVLKPINVLETGTHWGIGASYMGLAIQDNGIGHVDTIEFLAEIHKVAQERINRLGLSNHVTCHFGDVRMFRPSVNYDFIFLDTEPQTRFAELVQFYPYLNEGGFVFIHDTPRNLCQGNVNTDWPDFKSWPFGEIPEAMRNLVKEDKLRAIHFPTPRGLIGLYKTHSSDYRW